VFAICCLRLLWERFDVIEADHMPYLQLLSLKLVVAVRRRRLVVTWHECWGPDYWRSYLGQPGRIGWLCETVAMRLPDTIISASPETAKRLREFTKHRVPIVVAPNGVDLAAIRDAEPAADPADIVAVGRLLPHKRIDLLLQAIAILREEGRPVTARVIGTGPHLEALTSQASALGLSDFVDFRQDVAGQDSLYGALKAARTAVFPSEREGFGIAVLEALACGVPVVTTAAPDNLARHLVERSDNGGIVCEPTPSALADAISAILDRSDAAATPDTRWLERYDWGSITESVAAALS
jgi:glycosyltransferase involved in cell wall biosynthesis